jgi:hypothetical protein
MTDEHSKPQHPQLVSAKRESIFPSQSIDFFFLSLAMVSREKNRRRTDVQCSSIFCTADPLIASTRACCCYREHTPEQLFALPPSLFVSVHFSLSTLLRKRALLLDALLGTYHGGSATKILGFYSCTCGYCSSCRIFSHPTHNINSNNSNCKLFRCRYCVPALLYCYCRGGRDSCNPEFFMSACRPRYSTPRVPIFTVTNNAF